MKRSKKQLIIGQGLAGSLLAMEMWEMGVEFMIVSAELPYSASRVAAGILNPITGKRLALTWRYGEFYEFAANRYATLEKVLESDFFEKMPLLRFFQNEQEIRIFEKKMNMPEYRNWLGDRNPPGCLGPSVKDDLGSFNILCAAALDTKQFVKQSARWLKNTRRSSVEK
jgi:glycine oxidase